MTVIQPNAVSGINSITVQSGNSLSIHKADGSLIRTITGVTGVTTFATVSVGSATTDFAQGGGINIGLGASISNGSGNVLTFGTNGDDRATIDASGNVRVGSGTPSYNFEVQNSGNIEFLLGSTNAGGAAIIFDGDSNGDGGGSDYSQIFHDTSGDMNYRARGGSGASNHLFLTGTDERLRINSVGDALLGGHGSRIFDDTSATNVVVDVYGGTTAGKRGILSLSGRTGSDNADLGTIWFANENNTQAGTASHNASKLVASIDVKSETTDNNAGSDSGGHMIFSTKAEAGQTAERLRIDSSGRVGIKFTGNYTMNSSSTNLVIGDGGGGVGMTFWTAAGADNQTISFQTNENLSRAEGEIKYGPTNTSTAADRNAMMFRTNSTERFRIDSSGKVSVGDVTSNGYGSSLGQVRIINDASSTPASFALFGYGNTTTGDTFAKIQFAQQESGYGGQVTAEIGALAVGTDERGTDLIFKTRPNTSGSSASERLRIASTGGLGIAGANYGTSGQVLTSGGSGAAISWTTVSGGVTSDSDDNTVGGTNSGANVSGSRNTFFGSHSARYVSSGSDNIALGASALIGTNSAAVTGSKNIAIGSYALDANTSGYNHVAIGYAALTSTTTAKDNTVIGYQAGDAVTTGQRNTIVGSDAFTTATTANNNAAVGWEALYSTTTGYQNCAFGDNALRANTTGNLNTAVGRGSLAAATTAEGNVAVGAEAGDAITTGHSNTCLGTTSLSSCVTGNYNTAIGKQCMQNTTGGENTAVGSVCMIATTSGTQNVAMGRECLMSNTTGGGNVALGKSALGNNTTGGSNVAIGRNALLTSTYRNSCVAVGEGALQDMTDGYSNVAIGGYALTDCTTGYQNTAVGEHAGRYITSGDYNTLVGRYAALGMTTGNNNIGVGSYTFGSACTGSNNIGVGYEAAYSVTGGGNNTCVGKASGYSLSTGSNNLLLGMNAGGVSSPSGTVNSGSNIVCLGNDQIANLYCQDTSISSSDSRDKSDITNFTPGLAWIKAMRPVTYKWDKRSWYLGEDETDITAVTRDGSKKKSKVNIGFVAQEVLAVEQANGFASDADSMLTVDLTPDGNRYGLKYERLVPVLVNAIKELETRLAALESA